MEALEIRALARLGVANPYAGAETERRDHDRRRSDRRQGRACSSGCAPCSACSRAPCATTSRRRSRTPTAAPISRRKERAILKNVLALHDDPRGGRHGAARRHGGAAARRDGGEAAGGCSAPPAIRACRSITRRSTTRAAWSTSATSSISSPPSRLRPRSPPRAARRKARIRHGDAARRDAAGAPGAVRAAVDAGARPARADAGRAHPYRAGDRRIRRHRRPRLDRGHRRDRSSAISRTSTTRPRASRSRCGPDGKYTSEARAPLDEVAKTVGLDVGDLEEAEDVDTIGGLVTAIAGRVPARGEIVAGPQGFEFEVLDADPRRLKRIKIHPPAAGGRDSPPAGDDVRVARRHIGGAAVTLPRRGPRAASGGFRRRRHPRLGLAAAADRLGFRRHRRAGAAAVRLRAGDDRADDVAVWLIDGSAEAAPSGATRWASLKSAFARRLVVGLRLSSGGAVVARRRLPGRRRPVPLGAAARRRRAADRSWRCTRRSASRWRAPFGRTAPRGRWRSASASTLAEFARANLVSGFPWNEYGMALGQSLWPAQIAASSACMG